MDVTEGILNVIATMLTILLTGLNLCKFRQVKKVNKQILKSKNRVEEIEEAIKGEREKIINNHRIANIVKLKEKTSQFQTITNKYLKNKSDYVSLGSSMEEDLEKIRCFMSYLQEESWLFDEESDNHAKDLYSDLNDYVQTFESGFYESIHNQTKLITRKVESFKSKIGKMNQDSMLQ